MDHPLIYKTDHHEPMDLLDHYYHHHMQRLLLDQKMASYKPANPWHGKITPNLCSHRVCGDDQGPVCLVCITFPLADTLVTDSVV